MSSNHILVHTGQNYDYELNQLFFEDLSIRKPGHFLEAVGENAAQTIARVIEKADAVMEQEQPDAIMLYGDTNSCLAVIAAKRRKIPVFRMEAGNRCFDQRVPEELNRADDPKCPHCDATHIRRHGKEHGLQRYRCTGCSRTFNALTGTPLARLRHKDRWLSFARSLEHSHSGAQSGALLMERTAKAVEKALEGVLDNNEVLLCIDGDPALIAFAEHKASNMKR